MGRNRQKDYYSLKRVSREKQNMLEECFYRHLFIGNNPPSQPIWNEWNQSSTQATKIKETQLREYKTKQKPSTSHHRLTQEQRQKRLCKQKRDKRDFYHLWAFATKTTSKLHILRLNSDTFTMDSTQVGVYNNISHLSNLIGRTFEQGNEVCFNGFLQSTDSARLESQVSLEILSDFSDETLESTLMISMSHNLKEYTEVCEWAIQSIFGNDEFHEVRRYQDGNDGVSWHHQRPKGNTLVRCWWYLMECRGLTGADLRAALLASCLRGAFPPVDLRAVCYFHRVRIIQKQ